MELLNLSKELLFPYVNNICHVSHFLLDPAHNTCTDPGTPHFGVQNSSRGYEVILLFYLSAFYQLIIESVIKYL